MTPEYISFSNIIIDDIVLWDGQTFMGTLGGSGLHALTGMRVWSDRLGCVAAVGPDFSPAQRAQLAALGVDLRGVLERAGCRTPRAWQIFEPDERRIEIFRSDLAEFYEHRPQFEDMPPDYRQARGVHIQWGRSFAELYRLMDQFRQANPAVCLVWEPALEYLSGGPDEFQALFRRLDLVSPDLEQAQSLTHQAQPEAMGRALLEWGTPHIAIRMGARGSLVCTAGGEGWRIPAVPTRIVDVTGAGNAYCGGFLVGLGQGLDPLEAGLRAAVSASFALEQFGVPTFADSLPEETARRLAWARDRVETWQETVQK
jgi:sugar/nucleoside kinase (ribokinase family)